MPQTAQPTIHQEVTFKAAPRRIYAALSQARLFAELTGAPAEIDATPGGAFTGFGGKILGRNLELVPDARIVQGWRAANWPEGVYSIARFELQPLGPETRLVFDHSGFPADQVDHLEAGWHKMYWEPLKKYLE